MRSIPIVAVLMLAPFLSSPASSGSAGGKTPGCQVKLTGAVQSSSGCIVTANYYFEGGDLIGGRKNTLVSLVAMGADLPKELQSVSINLEIPGEPKPGKFGMQTLPATEGAVVTRENRVFGRLEDVSLELTGAKLVSTAEAPEGFASSRIYALRGTLRFTVSDKGGRVTVTSSF